MANICNNEIQIFFKENTTITNKKKIVKELFKESNTIEIHQCLEEVLDDCEHYETIEISFDSRWVAPTEYLKYIVESNNFIKHCKGVAFEWGGCYVESFSFEN